MRVQPRLARYLRETGTQIAWLAREAKVSRRAVYDWLDGARPSDEHRERVLEVLRRRQDEPVGDDLFDETEGSL